MKLGFLDRISGKRGSLTVNSFNGIPIFANDYIGTETLATLHTGVTRTYAGCLGGGVGLTAFIPAIRHLPQIRHHPSTPNSFRLPRISSIPPFEPLSIAENT